MKVPSWRELLSEGTREDWVRELDAYESQLALKQEGRLSDKVFAETRLRRGAYGQRYDNGSRHDGSQSQTLGFDAAKTKGPNTLWDAPGMQRIKIPGGQLNAHQLEVLCDLAEEYSDQILHITTRQDVQLHYVHLEDTPDLMRRLAGIGITTREACGNSVRNVTCCQIAGVCQDEAFDVTPYSRTLAFFLLGHPETQDMGRKFKVAFSGCAEKPCGLAGFHDIGCIAKTRQQGDRVERGFAVYVGGGLGPVPHASELFDDFVPFEKLFPLSLAICRVFSKYGERENRSRARMKFLLMKLGLEEFRQRVLAKLDEVKFDPRWKELAERAEQDSASGCEQPGEPVSEAAQPMPEGSSDFFRDNVMAQRQEGYSAVTIKLPLGDMTPFQGRRIADLARRYSNDNLRTTVEQNVLLRWVHNADLPALYAELAQIGLTEAGASGITDVVSCPGTDTCKLGISSSRGLAAELRRSLKVQQDELPDAARNLHIKCSGCFNSCAQHHVADIGFLGVSRKVNGTRVPHFQLVVGGSWAKNGSEFGLAIGAIPSKRVPEVVKLLTETYAKEREGEETFQQWVHRVGRRRVKEMVADLCPVPPFEQAPDLYRDWGDPRVFSIGDIGVGECAGEVISPSQFALAEGERLVFEAQLLLDEKDATGAAERALAAMSHAARAVCLPREPWLTDDAKTVGETFDRLLGDNGEFDSVSPGGRFSRYFVRARNEATAALDLVQARKRVEEAQLFIDAAHAYQAKGEPTAQPEQSGSGSKVTIRGLNI